MSHCPSHEWDSEIAFREQQAEAEHIRDMLIAAYRFITQPKKMTTGEATYSLSQIRNADGASMHYSEFVEQLGDAVEYAGGKL